MKRHSIFVLLLVLVFISFKVWAQSTQSTTKLEQDQLIESINKMDLFSQDKDSLICKYYDTRGWHAVIRVIGYTKKDDGAVRKEEDSLQFLITECSIEIRDFIINDTEHEIENGNLLINLAVPHEYDPSHTVKKSNVKNQLIVVINLFGDFNKGGWNNTNKLMMFQNIEDLKKKYVDDFSESDYEHFNDDM